MPTANLCNHCVNANVNYKTLRSTNNVAKMKVLNFVLLFVTFVFLSDLNEVFVCGSPMLVENGIYSRVTVQIEPQPQPKNCVEFLDKLEVGQ